MYQWDGVDRGQEDDSGFWLSSWVGGDVEWIELKVNGFIIVSSLVMISVVWQ